MLSKVSPKQLFIIFSIVGIALFSSILLVSPDFSRYASIEPVEILIEEKPKTPLPVRLKIPKIGIDAAIEYVGLTSLGAMDSPRGPNEVGWLDLGARPGEVGSAVIDGHSGWKDNMPAVFDNLGQLESGDKIYVENTKGEAVVFVVRETRIYDPDADATEVFSSNDGKAYLNLITCTGDWDNVKKSSTQRLVVFAERE